jgi:hypothetical protein
MATSMTAGSGLVVAIARISPSALPRRAVTLHPRL